MVRRPGPLDVLEFYSSLPLFLLRGRSLGACLFFSFAFHWLLGIRLSQLHKALVMKNTVLSIQISRVSDKEWYLYQVPEAYQVIL